MANEKKITVGGLDELILLTVLGLGEEAYGVPIRHTLEERAGRSVPVGQLYAALDRLEEQGYLSSEWGGATAERGGRRKKYFKVEGLGSQALENAEWDRRNLRCGLGLSPVGVQV